MIEGMLKSWYRTWNYDVIRDFISSIIAVISVLVILVGTYITLSEIKFEAEEPALVKHGFHPVVVFPELDRNNQV